MAEARLCQGAGCAPTPSTPARDGDRGPAAVHPEGRPAAWIPAGELASLVCGRAHPGARGVIVLHLLQVLRRYGHEFVGIQETQSLLDQLARTLPALVREVVPRSFRRPC